MLNRLHGHCHPPQVMITDRQCIHTARRSPDQTPAERCRSAAYPLKSLSPGSHAFIQTQRQSLLPSRRIQVKLRSQFVVAKDGVQWSYHCSRIFRGGDSRNFWTPLYVRNRKTENLGSKICPGSNAGCGEVINTGFLSPPIIRIGPDNGFLSQDMAS